MSSTDVLPRWYQQASRRLEHIDDEIESRRARWMLALSLGTWVPLVVLAALGGVLNLEPRSAAFIFDLPVHARLLLAVPLLIDATIRADRAVSLTCLLGLERVTAPEDAEQLRRAQALLVRARRSLPILAVTAALAILAGVRYAYLALSSPFPSWLHPSSSGWLSASGLWYCAIGVPLLIFLLLRVGWRWALWVHLLVRIARLRLTLVASHGDNAGGLGILGLMPMRFIPSVVAVSLVVGMTWMKEILYLGAHAQDFARPAGGLLVLMLLLFFSPPLVFVRQLTRLKLQALHDVGELVFRTNAIFERRWSPSQADANVLLDVGEASTVADLGTIHSQVDRMWVFPFRRSAFIGVIAAVVIPLLPVVVVELGVRELLKDLAGALL